MGDRGRTLAEKIWHAQAVSHVGHEADIAHNEARRPAYKPADTAAVGQPEYQVHSSEESTPQ